MGVAVMMSVIVGMNVSHGRMLYYNITGVHALARSQVGVLAAPIARALLRLHPRGGRKRPSKRGRRRPSREGAGKTGCALHPRSRVQKCVKENAHEHTGSAEAIRPSLRGGLRLIASSLPGDRAFLPPSPALLSANLTPASGRQDHTTSPSAASAVRQKRRRVHRIPPRIRDDRERPSGRRDGNGYSADLRFGKSEYFRKAGWTNRWRDLPDGQHRP